MISEHSISSHPHADRRSLGLSLGTVWHRLAVLAIATLAAALNFYGLSREGYNNEFYAAAVRSMSESWHNFFFASFDPGGFVTIDKPPLGFWFQVASVKVFGFNGTALLIPEAVAGVLSVLLLYSLVARTFGRVAGLIAALALAVTPISVVTSRNNTIDSILVLCVLLGAWAVLRAAETGRLRWLLLCAAFVGLGFNIKMLEAYLVVPAFGLVYLLGARTSVRRRIVHLVAALVVLLAISLSWAAAVDLTPASQRPWVDSTTTNSELDLAIGYNGLQRLTGSRSVGGSQTGPPGNGSGFARLSSGTTAAGSSATTAKSSATGSGSRLSIGGGNGPGGPGGNGGPGGVGENGPVGALRLLDTQLGSQIGWLLPLAILGFLVAVWQTRPRLRTLDDRQRSLALWGTWLLTTGVFFSIALFYHTYYLVMVAPAVAALAGIGITALWRAYRTSGSWTWWVLPLGVLAGAATEAHILSSYPAYARWLTPLVIALCGFVAAALVLLRLRPSLTLRAGAVAALTAVVGLMAPPTVFAAYTAQHPETGNIVRAGPAAAGTLGGFGGQGGPPPGAPGSAAASSASGATSGFVRLQPTPKPTGSASVKSKKTSPAARAAKPASASGAVAGQQPPPGAPAGAQGGAASAGSPPSGGGAFGSPPGVTGPPNGTPPGPPPGTGRNGSASAPRSVGSGTTSPRSATSSGSSRSSSTRTSSTRSTAGTNLTGRLFGGPGSMGGPGGQVSPALISYLIKHRGTATYLVATPSSNAAAPIIIKTGLPVMSLGGFTGSDPILTTTKLAALARSGAVKYFLIDGGGPGGPDGGSRLTTWVQRHSKLITVAGTKIYRYTG